MSDLQVARVDEYHRKINALLNAPEKQLRAAIRALCGIDETVHHRLADLVVLLVREESSSLLSSSSPNSDSSGSSSTSSSCSSGYGYGLPSSNDHRTQVRRIKKRKMDELLEEDELDNDPQVCIRQECRQVFREKDNFLGRCRFHRGNMLTNYDSGAWANHNEWEDGPINSDQMRDKFPERFYWDCCNQPGNSPGCCGHWHQANGDYRARRSTVGPRGRNDW